MLCALIKNGSVASYPYSYEQLKRDNPKSSFPRGLSPDQLRDFLVQRDVHEVTPTEKPEFDPIKQDIAEANPVKKRGKWVQAWEVVDVSDEEAEQRLLQKRATMKADRSAFAVQCAVIGLITHEEAEAWAGGSSLPENVSAAFAKNIADATDLLSARVNALTASHIHRSNPLILLLQDQFGLSDEQVDRLFD